jgi:trehalose-phosphatase
LDFDGTLSAIVTDPREARPLPGVPELLRALGARFELVAVISGRPTAFLRDALGDPAGVELAGLYGLERAVVGTDADEWSGVIARIVARAEAGAPAGVYVEPKGLTVTIHWRRAPEAEGWVRSFVEGELATGTLSVHSGRMELELRPALPVDKGTVVAQLAAEHGSTLEAAAAFGDDVGDLPAFAAVRALQRPDGSPLYRLTVAAVDAGSPPAVVEAADLVVEQAVGAVELLQALLAAAS